MAISINSIESLQEYLKGVMSRANHHAENVNKVSLTLLGAVIWKSDGEIKVREYKGSPANIIWFWVNDNRYAMSFNHTSQKIDLTIHKHNGTIVNSFDNLSSYDEIIKAFSEL